MKKYYFGETTKGLELVKLTASLMTTVSFLVVVSRTLYRLYAFQ